MKTPHPRKKKDTTAGLAAGSPCGLISVSPHDRRRIAVEAKRSVRCVENVLKGKSKPVAVEAVVEAAAKLGIPFVPEASA